MSDAASARRRGTELLLAHMNGPVPRPPVAARLQAELGYELAERLVAALRDQRDERRRGSSSP